MEYTLNDLFDLKMGKTPARNNPEYWNSHDHKWISVADLSKCGKYINNTSEYISEKAAQESGISRIPSNTVIMSFKLSIGKVAITSEPIYSNEAIMSFNDKGVINIIPDYFYYLLLSRDWSKSSNRAVMGATLNKATLSKIKVRIHNLKEQKKIVKILDKISSVIINRKQQLRKLDELIKARFVEMFGDMTLNPNGWEKVTIASVCDVRDGTHDSPKYFTEGYALVTSKNVTSGKIDFTGCGLICEDDFIKINERSKVDYGDILMPMIGTVGKPVIIDTDVKFAIKNVALIKFCRGSRVNNIFIRTLLESDYFNIATRSKVRGGTQKFIALGDLRKLEICLPPMGLQLEFANFVHQVDKSKQAIQSALIKAQLLFDSLMQEYFG